jgi:simple sugar transport system permease protein
MAVILLSSAVGYWLTERADQRVALWNALRRRRRETPPPAAPLPTGMEASR